MKTTCSYCEQNPVVVIKMYIMLKYFIEHIKLQCCQRIQCYKSHRVYVYHHICYWLPLLVILFKLSRKPCYISLLLYNVHYNCTTQNWTRRERNIWNSSTTITVPHNGDWATWFEVYDPISLSPLLQIS